MEAAIRVDCRAWLGPLRRIWASIGYDEINWTYTGRGRALYCALRELAETPYHVRNHNALTSGNGLSEPARGSTNVWRIDGQHSNAYAEWLRQGRPEDPTPAQLDRLHARQGLESYGPPSMHDGGPAGTIRLRFDLPLFGVSLLEVTPARAS
jgi:hypothetical protein